MIDFSSYTKENILYWQLQRITDAIDKREGSMIYTALGPAAWTHEGFYFDLDKVQKNAWVFTAVGKYLDWKTQERGIYRNVATPAKRLGVFNTFIPEGFRCSTVNGANSLTFFATADCRKEKDGYYVTLICEKDGTDGNDYYGQLLPITYITGLTTAQMSDILIPGTDEETDDALRNRYILSLKEQAFAGNIAAYRKEILDIDNVGAVQIYPVWQGGGTVKCSVLDANYNAASWQLVQEIQNYICPPEDGGKEPSDKGYGFAPIGAVVTISTATEYRVDLSIGVTLQPGYSISSVTLKIEEAFQNYLLQIRRNWGTPVSATLANYIIYVYIAQISSAILNVDGIVNVVDTQINGGTKDILLVENGYTQQVPVMGKVNIYETK